MMTEIKSKLSTVALAAAALAAAGVINSNSSVIDVSINTNSTGNSQKSSQVT